MSRYRDHRRALVARADAGDSAVFDAARSWAKPLLGRFAKRSVFYAYDPTGPVGDGLAFSVTAAVNATLKITDVEVRPDGEHVLRDKDCRAT